MSTTLLAVAVLPALVLMYYVYRLDRIEREPALLLVKLFLLGGISAFFAGFFEVLGTGLEGILLSSQSALYLLVDNFLCIALVEEFCKRFFLRRASWKHPAFNYCFDGVVYAVAVSLGFAALENIFYVSDYGVEIALLRAVTSIPVHGITGIYMGHYYGLAKMQQSRGIDPRRSLRKSLWIPVGIHGLYDLFASLGSGLLALLFFLLVVLLDIFALRDVNRFSQQDTSI